MPAFTFSILFVKKFFMREKKKISLYLTLTSSSVMDI